jgi:hypothetical protein
MLQTKAMYNLLRLNAREDASLKAEGWALEDLRSVDLPKLWKRLEKFGIQLDRESFARFAEETDGPEQLVDLFAEEKADEKTNDQIYLILFELWRRLFPERPSLSIFCDELDHRIDQYDSGQLQSDESIQDGLSNLIDILEEHVDAGMKPKAAFTSVSEFCAHDLSSFLYDYIADLLDQDNVLYASELIDDFYPYLSDPSWFDLLKARAATDPVEANRLAAKLLDKNPERELLFDTLRFLTVSGEHELFCLAMQKMIQQLQTEEELFELMELAADYYRRLDQDALEQSILRIKKQRESRPQPFKKADPDLKKLEEIILSK